ncbi:MAG: energy transducer TonB [Kiritimatiellae bacterium]|nr:energy transducer TonB [Kiritimatiellia bacterium]
MHAILAAGLALILAGEPGSRAPSLSVSRVELSFADGAARNVADMPCEPLLSAVEECRREKVPLPTLAPRCELSGLPVDAGVSNDIPPPATPPVPVAPPAFMTAPPAVSGRISAAMDAKPRPISAIMPVYPRIARLRNQEGTVLLNVDIDEKGLVQRAEIAESSGYILLDEAALDAVRKAVFSPAVAGSSAVPSSTQIPLVFRLK